LHQSIVRHWVKSRERASLFVAIDTADQAEDGCSQSREYHSPLLVAFQYVTELVAIEINFAEDSAAAVVVVKHTPGEL
jgi:hypothetical protein